MRASLTKMTAAGQLSALASGLARIANPTEKAALGP